MPGLAGMVSKLPMESCSKMLNLMVKKVLHEPFYNHGIHSNDKMFTHVGWTCHKNSFTDCMPIFNERQDIILFLSGEVFLDSDLINNLRKKGHDFPGNKATYLVHLYEELGYRFFEALNGQY